MASTVGLRYFSTSRKATNAALPVRTVGFVPKKVTVRNKTSNAMLEWHEGLEDGEGFKTVAAGTRTFASADGISPLAAGTEEPGFSLGTLADINDTVGEDLLIECWG